jgi:hypothetical protein
VTPNVVHVNLSRSIVVVLSLNTRLNLARVHVMPLVQDPVLLLGSTDTGPGGVPPTGISVQVHVKSPQLMVMSTRWGGVDARIGLCHR